MSASFWLNECIALLITVESRRQCSWGLGRAERLSRTGCVQLIHDPSDRTLSSLRPTFPARSPVTKTSLALSVWGRGKIRRYTPSWRDQHAIHSRCAEPPTVNPDKYADELLDAYLFIENADALYAEYAANGVEFARELANMPWHSREFVIRDCDGRLLAFGSKL